MATMGWNQRFLLSTRGRILSALRRGAATVNDLAAATGLSDNGVRAHLNTLERDGLVRAGGSRPGTRKPNIVYELTPEASQVFPKPYAAVLQQLMEVLAARLAPADLDEILRDVGRRVAADFRPAVQAEQLRPRVLQALAALEAIGGLAELEENQGRLCIRGLDCPLGAAVTGHRQVCRVAEAMLTDLLGVPVRERCQTDGPVRCYFDIVTGPSERREGGPRAAGSPPQT